MAISYDIHVYTASKFIPPKQHNRLMLMHARLEDVNPSHIGSADYSHDSFRREAVESMEPHMPAGLRLSEQQKIIQEEAEKTMTLVLYVKKDKLDFKLDRSQFNVDRS